ncbi:DDB1- and CUL4-associated factor 11-like [Sycon ciliatum]|uniref:DDB1- and CUL4-associated factor 11-like n=1 Tax=Sycon ciliatum TaxID=27933 RepID=UPI0020A8D25D|eukprot:scpid40906/ scgid12837/ DDB1- and CUL4-associated factor 11; WD repeat-containing protein 23
MDSDEDDPTNYPNSRLLDLLGHSGRPIVVRSSAGSQFVVIFADRGTNQLGSAASASDQSLSGDENMYSDYSRVYQTSYPGMGRQTRRMAMQRRSAKKYNKDHPPCCDGVDKTDIGRQIQLESGGRFERCSTSRLLRHREYAVRSRCMPSRRAQLGNRQLPDRASVVISGPSRVFIGRFSEKGDIFVSCSQSGRITILKVDGRRLIPHRTIAGREVGWSIIDMAFSPDEQYGVYSSWCHSLYMINLNNDTSEVHTPLDMDPEEDSHFCAFSLQFSSDNHQIMAGCNYGQVYMYDRMRGARTLAFQAHDDDVNTTCFGDASSHILFSGSDDCVVKAWDRRTLSAGNPEAVATFHGHSDGLTCVSPRGDGRYLISNSKDHSMKLWDVRKPAAASMSPEQSTAATATAATERRQNDSSVMTYRGHTTKSTLVRCAFSPAHTTGQRYVYTGSALGACVIYDVLTGEVAAELQGHTGVVRDVSWHPTNPGMITTASWDGDVKLWQRNVTDEMPSADAHSSYDASYGPDLSGTAFF